MVTLTATSQADPSKSASAVLFLYPTGAAIPPIRVNAGGPAITPHHLVWAPREPRAGEVVFLAGGPRATSRGATVAQLETVRDVRIPALLYELTDLNGALALYGTPVVTAKGELRLENPETEFFEPGEETDPLHSGRIVGRRRQH